MALEPELNKMIRKMASEDGYTAEQISGAIGMSVEAVTMVLAAKRETSKLPGVKEKLLEYEDVAVDTIANLAGNAENEAVRLRASELILDYTSGNKEPKRLLPDENVVNINVLIQQARRAYDENMKQLDVNDKVIDLVASKA